MGSIGHFLADDTVHLVKFFHEGDDGAQNVLVFGFAALFLLLGWRDVVDLLSTIRSVAFLDFHSARIHFPLWFLFGLLLILRLAAELLEDWRLVASVAVLPRVDVAQPLWSVYDFILNLPMLVEIFCLVFIVVIILDGVLLMLYLAGTRPLYMKPVRLIHLRLSPFHLRNLSICDLFFLYLVAKIFFVSLIWWSPLQLSTARFKNVLGLFQNDLGFDILLGLLKNK